MVRGPVIRMSMVLLSVARGPVCAVSLGRWWKVLEEAGRLWKPKKSVRDFDSMILPNMILSFRRLWD